MPPNNPRFQSRISTNQTFPPPRIIPDNFPSDSGPKPIPLQYRSKSKHQSLENAITGCPNTASLEGKKKKNPWEKERKKLHRNNFWEKSRYQQTWKGGGPRWIILALVAIRVGNFRSVTWPTLTLLCVPFATRAGGGGRKEGRKTIGRGGWKVKPGL